MYRKPLYVLVFSALALAASPVVLAQQEENQEDHGAARATDAASEKAALCPVSGKPIDRTIFTRFRGKRVYFADAASKDKFLADPTEYAEALKAQWKALTPLRVQVTGPVTGDPIDKRFFVETPEQDIYFASAEAKAKWESDPKKFAEKLDSCYTFQTHCGTCDGDINPSVFEERDGQKIYFCCPGCRGMFEKDPAKFMKKYEDDVAANEAAWKKLHTAANAKPVGPAKPVEP